MIARRSWPSVARPRRPRRAGAERGQFPSRCQGRTRSPSARSSMRPTPVTSGLPVLDIPGRGPADAGTGESDLRSQSIRLVVDRTGLTGLYDFELQFSMRQAQHCRSRRQGRQPATHRPRRSTTGRRCSTRSRELGLKLESERGPVEHSGDRQRGKADRGLRGIGDAGSRSGMWDRDADQGSRIKSP